MSFTIPEKYLIYPILISALFLRVLDIGKRDFWYDEAYTGIVVKQNFPDMMKDLAMDVHPPLYYVSAKIFSFVFNYSVTGIRLHSAIYGVLGVAAVYFFARELISRKAAIWASLLTAISPFAIQYSQEARMYTMYAFLIMSASYFFLRAIKSGKKKYYIWWGLLYGLSMLTFYMSALFVIVYYAIYLLHKYPELNYKNKISFEAVKKLLPGKMFVSGYLLSVAIFSPWLPGLYEQLTKFRGLNWVVRATPSSYVYDLEIFFFGSPEGEMSSGVPQPNSLYSLDGGTVYALVAVFMASLLYYFLKKKRKKAASVTLFSLGFMAIVYILSQFGINYFVSRFLIPASYFLFVLVGMWLAESKIRHSLVFLALYLALLANVVEAGYSTGYNELAVNMQKYKNNDFYVLNLFDYVVAKYYFGAEKVTLYNIDWPAHDPTGWPGVGNTLKRTQNYDDLKRDENALIIYNTQLLYKDRSDKKFNPQKDGFFLVEEYKNIEIYQFDGQSGG